VRPVPELYQLQTVSDSSILDQQQPPITQWVEAERAPFSKDSGRRGHLDEEAQIVSPSVV
jgi:hypothetical protein